MKVALDFDLQDVLATELSTMRIMGILGDSALKLPVWASPC